MILSVETIEDKKKKIEELQIKTKDGRQGLNFTFDNDEVCNSVQYIIQDFAFFIDP